MTTISVQTNFIDNIAFAYLMIWLTQFLKENLKKRDFINDILGALIVGGLGFIFRSFNLVVWVFSTLIYQKLRYHQLDYEFLNRRLFAIILSSVSVMISDGVESIIRMLITKYDIIKISNDFGTYVYIILYILIAVVFVILLKRTGIYKDIEQKIMDLEISRTIFRILFFLVISIVTILLISQIAQITALIQVPLTMIFFIFIGLTLIELFAFIKSYSYKKDAETQIVQNQQLKEYLNNIEQQYQDIRRFKHDYNNMLLALEEFTKKDNQKQFKEYYQELVKEKPVNDDVQRLSISHIDSLQNEPLKGLIIQKFFAAQRVGVDLQIEIDDQINIMNTDILPIVRILGILLDNAIEHSAEEKEKEVECAFIKSSDLIEVMVSNRAPNLKNIDQLFQNGYTTKVNHTGFGLANVKELLDKNKSLLLENSLNEGILKITLIIMTGE
ncbi:sensor histidine kinase [Xylocopilactobacillus apis]|uniref:Histidine kinase n=1 Tax=Xylocopilactobacillus apis TaxID=2932183 RepID=A0AAU9DPT0_9LACO|nr:GHKL domain-containing protein [Xylocopilactobacillus apis]BDR57068.1 histidine kinase [Xylocopilactobacillus apis]